MALLSSYIVFFSFTVFASQVELDSTQSKVEFLAIGNPSALKIKGQGANVKGNLAFQKDNISGELLVNLEDFKTGIATRDKHMKEKYLEIEKPENKIAKLTITKIDLPATYWNKKNELKNVKFTGKLNLHGVPKEIEGTTNLKAAKNNSVEGESSFKIKLSEYAIAIPSFAGITVAEDVNVTVQFVALIK